MNELVEKAVARFESGLSCSQAILIVFGERFGLSEDDAVRIARGFGGGMARLSETCGAVSGAAMVLGLTITGTDKQAKEDTYALVQEFAARFKETHGSLNCARLLGCDLGAPGGQQYFREQGLMAKCTGYVRDAAVILDELLSRPRNSH